MGVPMHAWDRVSSLLVADDHHLPYRCIPATGTAASKKEYTAADFERFIVPLPEKIFYPAEAVARHADAFAKVLRRYMPMPDANEIVLRYFVTTVSSLRAYVRANADELCSELVTAIMQTETAQFVWIIEYASARQWRDKQVAVRAVVDATATPQDPSPAWFAHGANSAIFFDRTRVHAAATSISWSAPDGSSLRRMDLQQNLRDVVAKT
jgi:hypothetical protein